MGASGLTTQWTELLLWCYRAGGGCSASWAARSVQAVCWTCLIVFLSKLGHLYLEIIVFPIEKGGEADNRSCLFPADEGFKKFQKLNSYHSQQGKIQLIVTDKFLLLLTAYNAFYSWDELNR